MSEATAPDTFPTTPRARVYVHHTGCQGETEISGNHFVRLCDPYSTAEETFCAGCGAVFYAQHFQWQDTGESLRDYRQRMKQFTPPIVKQWYKWLYLIPGVILGVIITIVAVIFLPRHSDISKLTAGLLLSLPAIVIASYLTNLIGGIMLRSIKSVDYCKIR
jgi:hypothetical protein